MLISNELRWFYPGSIPEDMELWFKQNCLLDSLQSPEEREDVYLYSPCDFLGIKLRLSIRENPWWSLAFETRGQEACLMDNLQKTANWVFKTYKASKLLAADSFGYPNWLELVCR